MERLLVVEHHRLFREGLALLLEWRTGLSSIPAESLAEAKAVLEEAKQKPACIIVDLDLPDGQGTEVLKELDGLPVLALITAVFISTEPRPGSRNDRTIRPRQ
jgi:DNA-binding NarL/FixJ family response regulator